MGESWLGETGVSKVEDECIIGLGRLEGMLGCDGPGPSKEGDVGLDVGGPGGEELRNGPRIEVGKMGKGM